MAINVKSLSKIEGQIYKAALAAVKEGVSSTEFSVRFFGPKGMLGKLCRTKKERKALVKHPLYKWLQEQFNELRRRDADEFRREVESLSGRLTVVVPKSLHGALRREAAAEGISLSELIRLKLAVPFSLTASNMARGPSSGTGGKAA